MWRKICHMEKFQIYMHERCGEIWNFSTCAVISNYSKWQMWRNLKFLHSWHVYDVENVLKCVHVMLFCWKIGFVVIYAVCREICFDAIYALLCGEKLNQRLRMWRKNDKYEVWKELKTGDEQNKNFTMRVCHVLKWKLYSQKQFINTCKVIVPNTCDGKFKKKKWP